MRPRLPEDDIEQYADLLARMRRLETALVPESLHLVGTSTEPSFENGWVNFDASLDERSAGFYRHGGRVYLNGVIKSGVVGQSAFTLPVGYIPATATQPLIFITSSNSDIGTLFVYPSGAVLPALGSNIYFELDGASFLHA